jgi:hypothetical protein
MQMRWGWHGVKSAPGIVRLSHPVMCFHEAADRH